MGKMVTLKNSNNLGAWSPSQPRPLIVISDLISFPVAIPNDGTKV